MSLQFSSFEICHRNSQDSSKNGTLGLPKTPLQWHISKDENWSGISQIRNNYSGINLINPFFFHFCVKKKVFQRRTALWANENYCFSASAPI
jgi:hypothetical protein